MRPDVPPLDEYEAQLRRRSARFQTTARIIYVGVAVVGFVLVAAFELEWNLAMFRAIERTGSWGWP